MRKTLNLKLVYVALYVYIFFIYVELLQYQFIKKEK